MKKIYLLIVMTMFAMTVRAAVADETMLFFGLNHYEDWTYNRSYIVVDNDAISLDHITLYTGEDGRQYTLESPAFACQGIDSLRVALQCRLAPDNNYSPTKVAPRVELLDADRTVVEARDFTVEPNQFLQTMVVTVAVPVVQQATLLFSAPRAMESENNLPAVKQVQVWAVTAGGTEQPKPGDINGDGNVDVADVNLIINLMLGKANASDFRGNADVTGDGLVDVGDVNQIINMMLGKQTLASLFK